MLASLLALLMFLICSHFIFRIRSFSAEKTNKQTKNPPSFLYCVLYIWLIIIHFTSFVVYYIKHEAIFWLATMLLVYFLSYTHGLHYELIRTQSIIFHIQHVHFIKSCFSSFFCLYILLCSIVIIFPNIYSAKILYHETMFVTQAYQILCYCTWNKRIYPSLHTFEDWQNHMKIWWRKCLA